MERRQEFSAIVLAGGRSSRMGQPKATLTFYGQTLLERIVSRLRPAFDEIVIVAAPEAVTTFSIDVAGTLRDYTRLEQLATSRAHIVPGHDPLVLVRYPAWKPLTQGSVHRLDVPRLN